MAKIEIYKKETFVDKAKKEAAEASEWVKRNVTASVDWCKANPMLALEILGVVTSVIGASINLAAKVDKDHKKYCEVWDAKEEVEFDQRLEEGQSRTSALEEMGLLK